MENENFLAKIKNILTKKTYLVNNYPTLEKTDFSPNLQFVVGGKKELIFQLISLTTASSGQKCISSYLVLPTVSG